MEATASPLPLPDTLSDAQKRRIRVFVEVSHELGLVASVSADGTGLDFHPTGKPSELAGSIPFAIMVEI